MNDDLFPSLPIKVALGTGQGLSLIVWTLAETTFPTTHHSYFSIGSISFQQTIGAPIGVDCAPAIANLTLFKYEYQFISKLIKSDYRRAMRYNGCFRLMDDISSVNGDGVFQNDIALIYPSSLDLKKENEGDITAHILDLSIALNPVTNLFTYKLYDKREHFKFDIVNYPDLKGNIAASCAYGVVKSELKRYAKLSSDFLYFKDRKDIFFKKLLDKHYDFDKIKGIERTIMFD